jgi:indole-3-glycerol phosphate synthase
VSRFLETMASRSRARADAARRNRSLHDLRRSVLSGHGRQPRPLVRFGESFDLIAEVKPRSPSEGAFPERDPAETAGGYARGGAAAISVLTEPSEFGGSLRILNMVSEAVTVPVMAKDFLVDPYQVYEAREAGADGILVIARILSDEAMAEVLDAVAETGMFSLVEAFDRDDLERVSTLVAKRDFLVGVNCRDLETLESVPGRHEELVAHIPPARVAVAESAIAEAADVERVASLGYGAALVGSILMRSADATGLVREMVDAGRRTVAVAR